MAVTQGAALEAFYGEKTAAMYESMMEDEMEKVKADLDLILASAPEGAVLDTCVGSGHYLAYLGQGRRVVGQDISDSMLQVAKKRLPTATLRRADMLEPLPSAERFAVVLNNFALHHATPDQARRAIRYWADALLPNGVLYVSAWEGDGTIDYGDHQMDALLVSEATLHSWIADARLDIIRHRTQREPDMNNMNAAYLVARKTISTPPLEDT